MSLSACATRNPTTGEREPTLFGRVVKAVGVSMQGMGQAGANYKPLQPRNVQVNCYTYGDWIQCDAK